MFGRNNNSGGGAAVHDNRPVCKFFLEGRCRFGDSCKNYHPQNQNSRAQQSNDNGEKTFSVTTDGIKADLTAERPIWPLSAYGPGINAPRQLLEGPLEQSFEEIRLLYYIAQTAGKVPEYVQNEQEMLNKSNEQVQTILKDLEGARRYILEGQHQHPNRNDAIIKPSTDFPRNANVNSNQSSQTGAFGQPSSFGGAAAPAGSAFGKPSAFGAQPSAFGAPSTLGGASGFGKPSALGSGVGSAASGFGKPSPLGGSAFGQPSGLGQSTAFGQPTQPSAFGAPSALGVAKPAFGQPSQPSAFGAPQAPAASTSAFGQPSQPSAFGQPARPSAFGQPSNLGGQQPTNSNNAFGQPSAFGASTNALSPFAAAAQSQPTPSPFAPANTASNPSAFGAPSAPANNAFGAPSKPNPFGAPSAPSGASPFAPKQTPAAASAPQNSAPFGSGGSTSTQNQSTGLQNKQIQYEDGIPYYLGADPQNPRDSRKMRAWFPKGRPEGQHLEAEGLAKDYDGEKGDAVKHAYEFASKNGRFNGGLLPEAPPKREWIGFDF